jgi:hypothetical protein
MASYVGELIRVALVKAGGFCVSLMCRFAPGHTTSYYRRKMEIFDLKRKIAI